MIFNQHFRLEGQHAFLSASKYHWINYEDEKLENSFRTAMAAREGTELHDLAARLIQKKIKLPRSQQTMNLYVNDAIGFKMTPEQVLYYSDNAFGTADAISFRKGQLRIHDLKTGVNQCSMHQLEIYTAFFCLEYNFKPSEFETELRIYQNDDVEIHFPTVEDIARIMDKIIHFDKRIELLKMEAMA